MAIGETVARASQRHPTVGYAGVAAVGVTAAKCTAPSALLRNAKADQPNIVFVHKIWADGSSYKKVKPTLQVEASAFITESSRELAKRFLNASDQELRQGREACDISGTNGAFRC